MFYQLKNGCNGSDLPKDLPPDSTVYWHYENWKKVKKIHLDSINNHRFSSSEKYL
ncbi:transposase [Cyanobacterium sp. HL-69]|uniref:transposase n=1 Tax=Cyanobacterium sp. HL-69 TaxID=2054282 RepID=UPI00406BA2D0